jgi:hypothetical protein
MQAARQMASCEDACENAGELRIAPGKKCSDQLGPATFA